MLDGITAIFAMWTRVNMAFEPPDLDAQRYGGTRVLSADRKTLTFTTKGVNANGQQVDNVAVFQKQ